MHSICSNEYHHWECTGLVRCELCRGERKNRTGDVRAIKIVPGTSIIECRVHIATFAFIAVILAGVPPYAECILLVVVFLFLGPLSTTIRPNALELNCGSPCAPLGRLKTEADLFMVLLATTIIVLTSVTISNIPGNCGWRRCQTEIDSLEFQWCK